MRTPNGRDRIFWFNIKIRNHRITRDLKKDLYILLDTIRSENKKRVREREKKRERERKKREKKKDREKKREKKRDRGKKREKKKRETLNIY